jgi:hypothetical protein
MTKTFLRTDGTTVWNANTQWQVIGIGTTHVSGRKITGWHDGRPVLSLKVQSFPYERFTRDGLDSIRAGVR